MVGLSPGIFPAGINPIAAALKASAELSMTSRRPMAGSDQAAKAVGSCQSAPCAAGVR